VLRLPNDSCTARGGEGSVCKKRCLGRKPEFVPPPPILLLLLLYRAEVKGGGKTRIFFFRFPADVSFVVVFVFFFFACLLVCLAESYRGREPERRKVQVTPPRCFLSCIVIVVVCVCCVSDSSCFPASTILFLCLCVSLPSGFLLLFCRPVHSANRIPFV
jgi:hypothetical protein